MTLPERSDLLDLERGIPTTAEDVAALERAKKLDRLSPEQYLQFLLTFTRSHPPGREIPPFHEPFRL